MAKKASSESVLKYHVNKAKENGLKSAKVDTLLDGIEPANGDLTSIDATDITIKVAKALKDLKSCPDQLKDWAKATANKTVGVEETTTDKKTDTTSGTSSAPVRESGNRRSAEPR